MSDAEPERPTLEAQVTAVELAYVNKRGSIDILRDLVARNKRSPQELAVVELTLPDLRQAWLTMQFVAANAEKIRAATKAPDPGDPF